MILRLQKGEPFSVYVKHLPLMWKITTGKVTLLKEVSKHKYSHATDILLLTLLSIMILGNSIFPLESLTSNIATLGIFALIFWFLADLVVSIYKWGLFVYGKILTFMRKGDFDREAFYQAQVHTWLPNIVRLLIMSLVVRFWPPAIFLVIILYIYWMTLHQHVLQEILKLSKTSAWVVVGIRSVIVTLVLLSSLS